MGYKVYNPYLMAAIATISGFLFGFDISSVSSFVDQPQYKEYFNHPDSLTQGGITASMAGGSFLACLICGYVVDKFGRRPIIQVSSLFWLVGCAIQCSARNVAQLIVGRIISGYGIGFASSTVPVYVSELAPKRIRGRLGGLFQFSLTVGSTSMFFIGYGCSFIDGPASFRTAWGIMMVPGLLLLLGTFLLSESPRWLAKHGRWEEAIDIISKVQAGGNVNHPDVVLEIEEMRESIEIENMNAKLTVLDLFKKDSIRRTFVGISAQVWQQLTGNNVLMYYIVYMFKMAGFSGNTALVSSSIQYNLHCVMTLPTFYILDKWGRRRSLLIGSTGMGICLLIMSILFGIYSTPLQNIDPSATVRITVNNKHVSRSVIAVAYIFVAFYSPTWGPGIWLYCSEIFPTSQRGIASSLCAACNWIFNFALAMFVPSAFRNITWRTYIIFMTFCFTMTIHVFLMFPETKGRTLEEITMMWDSKVPAWQSAKWEPPVANQSTLEELGDTLKDDDKKDSVGVHQEYVETKE